MDRKNNTKEQEIVTIENTFKEKKSHSWKKKELKNKCSGAGGKKKNIIEICKSKIESKKINISDLTSGENPAIKKVSNLRSDLHFS